MVIDVTINDAKFKAVLVLLRPYMDLIFNSCTLFIEHCSGCYHIQL